jgi:hypothetical protein
MDALIPAAAPSLPSSVAAALHELVNSAAQRAGVEVTGTSWEPFVGDAMARAVHATLSLPAEDACNGRLLLGSGILPLLAVHHSIGAGWPVPTALVVSAVCVLCVHQV